MNTNEAEYSAAAGAQRSWTGRLCGLQAPFLCARSTDSAGQGLSGKQHAALRGQAFCVARPPPHAVADLASAARTFFDLDEAKKNEWVDGQDAFYNYRLLTGGRECFVVRDDNIPETLRAPARAAWRYFMGRSRAALEEIAARLGLPTARLTELLEGNDLPNWKSSSLLRCFRYPGTACGGEVLTLPHGDLGLLSFCWQTVPGLELFVADLAGPGRWLPTSATGELTILAGEALEVVSGKSFRVCTHRVVAAPTARHSIIFHLRLRGDALIDSERLRHPPHLPRLRLTAAQFVDSQNVRRPSRNQPATESEGRTCQRQFLSSGVSEQQSRNQSSAKSEERICHRELLASGVSEQPSRNHPATESEGGRAKNDVCLQVSQSRD